MIGCSVLVRTLCDHALICLFQQTERPDQRLTIVMSKGEQKGEMRTELNAGDDMRGPDQGHCRVAVTHLSRLCQESQTEP